MQYNPLPSEKTITEKTHWFNWLSAFCHLSSPATVTLSYQMTFDPGQAWCIPVVSRESNMYILSRNGGWEGDGED